MRTSSPDPVVRFFAKIKVEASGCWLWTGAVDSGGYGNAVWQRRWRGAHQVSYELHVGQVPSGLELDHLCRVTRCVNPDHLEPVTPAENMRRRYATYTHCKSGHEFTVDNTYIRPSGQRDCRACIRSRVARYNARKAAA